MSKQQAEPSHIMTPGPLMIGVAGYELSAEEQQALQHPWVSGVTLFKRNFASRQQVTELCAAIRACRPGPMLIAVDHEGGRVQRFHEDFTRLPPLGLYGESYRDDPQRALDHAYRHARVTAGELLACGIDLAFAPVMDLNRGSDVIGDRSFSAQHEVVTALSRAFLAGLSDGGMASVGKHFPGHGSVKADSHHHLVCDERPWDALAEDLQPFRELSEQLDAVMMAHVSYPQVDAQAAGFSRRWIHDILRQDLNFNGVVISDDLGMAGAAEVGDLLKRLQLALAAGGDIALICDAAESQRLLAAIGDTPLSHDASTAVARLAGRQRPDLAEYELVSEWRQWRKHLEALAHV